VQSGQQRTPRRRAHITAGVMRGESHSLRSEPIEGSKFRPISQPRDEFRDRRVQGEPARPQLRPEVLIRLGRRLKTSTNTDVSRSGSANATPPRQGAQAIDRVNGRGLASPRAPGAGWRKAGTRENYPLDFLRWCNVDVAFVQPTMLSTIRCP